MRILLAAIVAFAVAYLAIRYPARNEYKFLLYLVPLAAAVAALCLREQLSRNVATGTLLLAAFVLPGAWSIADRPWMRVLDPVRTDGPYLRALAPAPDELFQWIARNTRADAVFLAADLRVPPLGRRSLYIAVDAPWQGLDGWGVSRDQLLQFHIRRPDEVMHRRQRLATMVLDADWTWAAPEAVVAEIRRDVPDRPLYAYLTHPGAIARLEQAPGFILRFRNAAGSIYEIR
jgi:hypothetical protein